jgi:hypothetical protein
MYYRFFIDDAHPNILYLSLVITFDLTLIPFKHMPCMFILTNLDLFEYGSTVRTIISAPPLQNAVSHTTADTTALSLSGNATAVVASVLRWGDARHFAAVARL